MQPNLYDVVVIGGGIAGLTAGIYCGRAGLNVLILEKDTPGGYIVNAELVENFPGFPEGISGPDLGANIMSQAKKWGAAFKFAEIVRVEIRNDLKVLYTRRDNFSTKAIIVASGCRPKKLNIPGEEEFLGKNIFFCAMCDGNRFTNKEVAVIGGGEGGISEGLYLTRIASKVTIVEILPQLTAPAILIERAKTNSKVNILCSTAVDEISGEDDMINLSLKNVKTCEKTNLKVDGSFLLVGIEPQVEHLHGIVEVDGDGFILVTNRMETSVPGIFAAGDIRSGSARQAIAAAGDGAVAALSAQRFIREKIPDKIL